MDMYVLIYIPFYSPPRFHRNQTKAKFIEKFILKLEHPILNWSVKIVAFELWKTVWTKAPSRVALVAWALELMSRSMELTCN